MASFVFPSASSREQSRTKLPVNSSRRRREETPPASAPSSAATTHSQTMVRRRRRRRPPCGASWALSTLFVVVILLVLPTHTVAAESKKQALVNWLKRTFEGATDVTTPTDGSDPLYSISQPNKEQVQAVAQDLSSSLNQASDSAPDDLDPRLSNAAAVLAQSQAAQEPPSIISQLNLLLDAMELPRSTLGHLSELRPKDIQLVRRVFVFCVCMRWRATDKAGIFSLVCVSC